MEEYRHMSDYTDAMDLMICQFLKEDFKTFLRGNQKPILGVGTFPFQVTCIDLGVNSTVSKFNWLCYSIIVL